mgnify:CR=1 FL=1
MPAIQIPITEGGVPPIKPFSTYPEDRSRLMGLATAILSTDIDEEDTIKKAVELADLVKAILDDEAVAEHGALS